MSENAIELLTELETEAKRFAVAYPPPRMPPGSFRAPHKFNERLVVALSGMPVFSELSEKNFFTLSSTAPVNLSNIAGALIERVIDGVAPSQALHDITELVTKRSSGIYALMAVAGVSLNGVVDLEDGVTLMPAKSAPATLARETLFDLDRLGHPIFRGTIVTARPPGTALIVKDHMTVIGTGERDWRKHKALTDDIASKRDRALAALALSGADCAPYITSETSWINHPAYPYSGFGSMGYGTHHGVTPTKKGDADGTLAKALYQQFRALSDTDRTVLLRATERLTRSRSHPLPVDRAIDLGVVTEMIFLHDQKDQGELRFRTALRAAWLLGENGPDRRVVFNCVKKAYDARSTAVHTGNLSNQSLIDNLPRADRYCSDAMRRILASGKLPQNWDALVLEEDES